MNRRCLKALIFDMDGVVIDSESIWDRVQDEFLKRRGYVWKREQLKPLLAGSSPLEAVRRMQEIYGFDGDLEELSRERLEIYHNFLPNMVRFVDGFKTFFNEYSSSYRVAIATSADRSSFDLVDSILNLTDLFKGNIVTIDQVNFAAKPDPDLFLEAARRLRLEPGACMVIEDAPLGIQAAKAAEMMCIGLATTFPSSFLECADWVAKDYDAIAMIINVMRGGCASELCQ